MSERTIDDGFASQAGTVTWPAGPDSLTDTTLCPACFTSLSGVACPACGLELTGPASLELLARSTDAVGALSDRITLIGRLRVEASARRQAAEAAGVVPVPASAVSPVAAPIAIALASLVDPLVSIPVALPVAPVAPVPPHPAPPAVPRAPRRSSVQLLLLIVGVSLVVVAGIVFLTIAWIQSGLAFRSAVIAVATFAAFAVASWLRHRGLTSTSEGIGALAIALTGLDVWAVRANGLLGADLPDGAVYWGAALLLSGLALTVWSRLSHVRAGSLAGFTAVPIGAGLLVGGLVGPGTGLDQFLGSLTTYLVALVWALPRLHAAERVILWAITGLAAIGALAFAVVLDPPNDWAPAVALGAVGLVTALHGTALLRTVRRGAGTRAMALAAFAVTGAVPAIAVAFLTIRTEDVVAALWFCLLLPTVLALVCEFGARRLAGPAARPAARDALVGLAVGATATAGLAAIGALVTALTTLLDLLAGSSPIWAATPFSPVPEASPETLAALGALAVTLALVWAAWAAGRLLVGARFAAVHWSAAALIVLAVPCLGAPALVVAAAVLIAACAVFAVRARPRAGRNAPLLALASAIAVLGYVASLAEPWSWLVASVGVVALLLALRHARSVGVRLGLFLGACLAVLVAGTFAPGAVSAALDLGLANDGIWGVLTAGAVAAVLALPLGGFATGRERECGFALAAAAGAVLALTSILNVHVAPITVAVAAAALSLVAIALWLLTRPNLGLRLGRRVAAGALAAALWFLLAELAGAIVPEAPIDALLPAVAALLAAAAALVRAVRAPTDRVWVDGGAGLVLLVALAQGIRTDAFWVVSLVAAVATLLAAISADGLFGSRSRRRHLGWLALALAVAGLWTALGTAGVTALEPYVLPLGGGLLVVGALLWRFRPTDAPRFYVAGIVFAGFAVALWPLALVDDVVSWRSVAVGVAAALLVLVPLALFDGAGTLLVRIAAGAAGSVGVALTMVRHADGRGADLWLVAGSTVLAVGAFAFANAVADGRYRAASAWLLAGTIALTSALAVPAFDESLPGTLRAFVIVSAAAAFGTLGFVVRRPPLTPVVGWTGFATAGVAAAWASGVAGVEPFEVVTLPIAAGLLVHGWVWLGRSTVRSWPALGPGLVVLLVPPLLADFGASPLWRIVGLGVVALLVLLAGLRLRLQAPFLLGSIVLLWHAVAQLWPWIIDAYSAMPWWLWLGAGGTILIVLAARYERRMGDLRRAAVSIAALR